MEGTLTQFYSSVLQDPLFAAEGMDLEQGLAALERIEGQCQEAEALVGAGSWKRTLFLTRYPIAKYFLPIPFLRAFIESERARRVFVYAPTKKTAHRLLVQWEKTARVYRASIDRYTLMHKTLLELERKLGSFTFEDLAMNVNSLDGVGAILSAFTQNSKMLCEEIERRKALLTRGVPYKVGRYVPTLATYKPIAIAAEHQQLIDLELTSGFPFRDHTLVQTFGPFAYTLKHFDSKPTEHAFYAFILEDAQTQSRFLKISLADQFYFMDYAKGLDARNRALHAPIIERGIPYWFQSVTHAYACRDQLYVAEMATVIDLELRPWLNRERVSLQRSSMLDLVLMGASFDFDMYLANTKIRAQHGVTNGYSYLDALLMRTHPSIFFLPFNGSVWRLNDMPNFLGTRRVGEPQYVSLDMIKPKLAPGMLERIMEGPRLRAEARKASG